MNLPYTLYRCLTNGIYLSVSPAYWLYRKCGGKNRADLDQRLGWHMQSRRQSRQTPVIWIHAASVGEVNAASGIIEQLLNRNPGWNIVFSTTTRHGQRSAIRAFGKDVICIYAPLDFVASVRKALRSFRPDILVCIETEIWPNWLHEAHRMGIRTAIVNGRISVRSIQRYRKLKSLFGHVLGQVGAFSMIREEDASRIIQLGAPEKRVHVNGNAKYDRLARLDADELKAGMHAVFTIQEGERIIVAGSTRTHEEEILLDAYETVRQQFPDSKWIIAPRHIERAPAVADILKQRGIACRLRTDVPPGRPIPGMMILNTIGELQAAYSIADIAFCGGSLVPLGGHNILEAAAVGTPVFYGPHMDDFSDARELLESRGGGGVVHDARELSDAILDLLVHPEKHAQMKALAVQAVSANQGASERHAAVIEDLVCSS